MKKKIKHFFYSIACVLVCSLNAQANVVTLPELYDAPKFVLTNQNNQSIDSKTFDGKIWIASFLYTSCQHECPLMVQTMSGVQRKVNGNDKVIFVTITTDPSKDTSKVLKQYATQRKVDESNWHFLTGEKKSIVEIATNGFKLPASMTSKQHSQKFALVDQRGKVRGYFDSFDKKEMDRLASSIQELSTVK